MRRKKRPNSVIRLERTSILQLLADPQLYTKCQGFSNLQGAGLTATKPVNTPGCGRCGDSALQEASIYAFRMRFANLVEQRQTAALEELRVFLTAKLGYRPAEIVVHWRPASKKQGYDVRF